MKRYYLFVMLTIVCTRIWAQDAGTIHYTETRKLHFNIQGDMPPPPDLPTEHSLHTVLVFKDGISLYKNDAEQDNFGGMQVEDNGEDRIMMRMQAPDNQTYYNINENSMVRKQEFMDRVFLIEDKVDATKWKLTGNSKMILGLPCTEAVSTDTSENVSLWFTAAIPVSSGPGKYVGLPGMVLEVHIDNDEQVITAVDYSKEVNGDPLTKPKDGKKVTAEEYNKIVEEKMKEMGFDNGPGGNIMIRIENN
ncbi:MAG: GLPGLI family protein [Chitinophagales bacterium]